MNSYMCFRIFSVKRTAKWFFTTIYDKMSTATVVLARTGIVRMNKSRRQSRYDKMILCLIWRKIKREWNWNVTNIMRSYGFLRLKGVVLNERFD